MSLQSRLRYHWRTLFDRAGLDAELDAELADHVRRETEANVRRGMTPAEAMRTARLQFGAVQRYTEEARDARGLVWVQTLRQDLRFALRMLRKSPLFTGAVVITLALGIGLNTAVFSFVDATLLRPLPGVRAPSELVQVYRTAPGGEQFNRSSIPHFWDVRQRATDVFSGITAWGFTPVGVTVSGRPVRVFGTTVSADYFSVLGVRPALGRLFGAAEDSGRGAHPVVVLSDAGWRSLFNADPRVVGRTLLINGQRVEVIGVTDAAFHGATPLVYTALYMPLMQQSALHLGSDRDFEDRGNNSLNIVARLRPGRSLAQATDRLAAVSRELSAEFPDEYKQSGMNLVPQGQAGIHPTFRNAQVGMSAAVMAVVGLLLLIACTNVSNLFLARAAARSREMAIRLSLGARRGLLLRQLMVESLLFSLLGGALGVLLTVWTIKLANRITLPIDIDIRPDLRLSPLVLVFSIGVTVLASVLFGLVPALQATHPSLAPALKGEAPAGGSRSRAGRILVVAQMALSIMLLVCAGLFVVNLRRATNIDKGFVSDHLLIGQIDVSSAGYSGTAAAEFFRLLTERLSAMPSVRSVALVEEPPLGLNGSDTGVEIPGYVPLENEGMSVQFTIAGPQYFRTMGVPLVLGREFTPRDDSASVRALVVNQRFADRFWPGQDPIGRSVKTGRASYTVIGVVPTGKYRTLGESPMPHMWFAYAQSRTSGMTVVVRTVGDPVAFIGTLRTEVSALDAHLPISNVRSMENHLGISLMPARLTGAAFGIFGLLGLVLASVGMYGVMAYSVSQRSHEIGIRMALGATGGQVIRMIMRQGLSLVLIGTAIGLVGALMASKALAGILYAGEVLHPVAFGVVPLTLIGVAALATFLPARRAASIDPVAALRADT